MEKINLMDTTVEKILTDHEKEFMSAFRLHMTNVYRKLMDLKKVIEEQKLASKNDQRIKEFRTAMEWFRDEAL